VSTVGIGDGGGGIGRMIRRGAGRTADRAGNRAARVRSAGSGSSGAGAADRRRRGHP
jgi:hypothetical protein